MRKMRTVLASFAAFSLVLAACGGDDDDDADDTGVTEETGGTETATAADTATAAETGTDTATAAETATAAVTSSTRPRPEEGMGPLSPFDREMSPPRARQTRRGAGYPTPRSAWLTVLVGTGDRVVFRRRGRHGEAV